MIEQWTHVATIYHAMDRTASTGCGSIRGWRGFLAWRGSSTIIEVRLRLRQSKKSGEQDRGMSPLLQLEEWYFMTNNDNYHQGTTTRREWDARSASPIPSHPGIRLDIRLFRKAKLIA
jgi:hypothetical protein